MPCIRFAIIGILCLFISGSAWAADLEKFWTETYSDEISMPTTMVPILTADVLAKAQPDECYIGLGENNLYPFDFGSESCTLGKPKVNESYVFGMTRAGTKLWFGSAPNMGCLVYGTIAEQGAPTGFGGLVDLARSPIYATAVGLIMHYLNHQEDYISPDDDKQKDDFGIIDRMKSWLGLG